MAKAAQVEVREGFVDFEPGGAGKLCKVWYTVYGRLDGGKRPLVVLHGGPGLTHDYMLSLVGLAMPPHEIPIVFYDQLGCGRSTRLPEKLHDYSFWTLQLYLDELKTVLAAVGVQHDYDMYGHSWGGMLAATYAVSRPSGLRRLVLAGTAVTTADWMRAYTKYRDRMPAHHREVLRRPRTLDEQDTPEYVEALDAFYARHVMTVDHPPDYAASFDFLKQDPTVAMSTLGPSEFEPISFLKTWGVAENLHKIQVPTLLTNGTDEGADDESMQTLVTGIPTAKWVKFDKSSHMPHWEERAKHIKVVAEFLAI